MNEVVNIARCFERFADTFSPKIIAELNGQYVLAARVDGDKVPWHRHAREDEMFLVTDGVLEVHLRDRQVTVRAGEFFVVPRGVEHRVVGRGMVQLLLFEPAGVQHTGDVQSEITKAAFERLDPE